MGEKYLMFPVKDMRHLELYCNNCGIGVVLDLDNKTAGLPKGCPGCNVEFNGGRLPDAIVKLKDFRREMEGFTRQPQFRIKEE